MAKLPPGMPEPIDVHVGYRLRLRRTMLGISQELLGDIIGMSYQQIQKYECAATRISASKLFEFSLVLDVPVDFFFDEMPDDRSISDVDTKHDERPIKQQAAGHLDSMLSRETLLLVRSYNNIADPRMQKCLLEMYRLATEEDVDEGGDGT